MPTVGGVIAPEGALVQIQVGLSASSVQGLRAALRPIPPPVQIAALVDTGAEPTCISSPALRGLNLPLAGTTFASLPAHGGLTLAALFDASLAILHPSGNPRDHLVVRNLTVLELSLTGLGYDAVVGRDVLTRCRLLYHGIRSRFRLSY